ncbi:MAG: DNA repair protein RecO [Prevotellaceae bacterium]|jgi:DNA repair protein RecO (recombination protein O)|nr:DNA repair protein RecO [Prevotellaceae bacterium]
MLEKLTAIVLHTKKYRESSLLVYAYTNVFGRQTYVVNGVRSEKNKTGMALFQPLTLLDAVAYHNPKSDMQRLYEYRLRWPLHSIPFNITKNAQALFIGEVLYKTIREQEPNAELFDFLFRAIMDLDALEQGIANFHLYFLVHLLRYLGYAPGNRYFFETPYFDVPSGEFIPFRPSHDLFFDAPQTQLFAALLQASPGQLSQIALRREQRNRFIDNMLSFLNHHFDMPVPIHSAAVLQAVFG